MKDRIALLLGAGSSVGAGLPLTASLAKEIIAAANDPMRSEYGDQDAVGALNYVYGAMVGYHANYGEDPLQAVNIERLVSALRLLKDRTHHEVAPFVDSWNPAALGFGMEGLASSLGKDLVEEIGGTVLPTGHGSTQRVAEIVARISRIANSTGNPGVFDAAEKQVLRHLSKILGDIKNVDYLLPLTELTRRQGGGLDIISLNYDMTIEETAAQAGVKVERGIDRWNPGSRLEFSMIDGVLNLYKLHGSLDWIQTESGNAFLAPRLVLKKNIENDKEYSFQDHLPWIVLGDRGKLGTDGPTLALFEAAQEALRRASHLVVVGYSFSDLHINCLVRDWLSSSDEHVITILDKNWDQDSRNAFRGTLIEKYGASQSCNRESRVIVVKGTAEDHLKEALVKEPSKTPRQEDYVKATLEKISEEASRIHAILEGPDLNRVSISVEGAPDAQGRVPIRTDTVTKLGELAEEDTAFGYQNHSKRASIDKWKRGHEITLYCRNPVPGNPLLCVYGYRPDSAELTSLNIKLE